MAEDRAKQTGDGARELFLAGAAAAAELIDSAAVRDAWERPSALEGYTVSGLAGHLARAVLTLETYLAGTPPVGTELTDASGYLVAVLGDHDPIESDLHRTVRRRGRDTAVDGADELAASVRDAGSRLAGQLDTATLERPIEVLDGLALPVAEYLRTRLVELVIHLDDLAVSVGVATPVDEHAARLVASTLAESAARRDGGLDTVRGLARRERHPDAVRAL